MSKEMPHMTEKSLAEQFKIPVTTLKCILKNKHTIKAANREYGIHSKKRGIIQSGKIDQLEKALVQWLREARASNIPVNCQLLREKGIELEQTFGIENFSAFQGWIEKLKNRHGLAMTSVNEDNIEQWLSDPPTLLKDYMRT